MARPIWKGQISFGLVNIPVTLFSGEQSKELSFRMLDSRNNARVRYERVNEVTGEEVPWEEIVKAYEYEKGEYVLLTDEDFERAAVENTQTVEIEDFVDAKSIDVVYFDKPYYLVPGKKGEKGYVLLRETLKKTNKVGIAKVVIRTRQHLAAVMPVDNALVLNILRFQEELRDPSEYDLPDESLSKYKVTDKELAMAEQLVETMSDKWKPEKYKDEYRDALLEWIEKKARAHGEITPPAPPKKEGAPAGEIVDFMSLLKKSVQRTSEGRKKAPAAKKVQARSKPKTKAKSKPKTKAKRKKAS